MSFLSGLCGCFAIAPKTSPRSAPTPAMAETHPRNAIASPFPHAHGYDYGEALGIADRFGEDGYAPPVPLPRYTPRPMSSIQEKTLEGDAPISSSRSVASLRDEKNPRDFAAGADAGADADELVSDASSAISFPSSYGNTSTATRETPPPPYSPAPSRAMSFSSLNPPPLPAPPPVAHVARPGRGSEDQRSLRSRRVSWGSQ